MCADLLRLDSSNVTYSRDDGANMTWTDHILCSKALDIDDIYIHYDYICSDNKPLSVCLKNVVSKMCVVSGSDTLPSDRLFFDWSKIDLSAFECSMTPALSCVDISTCLLRCNGHNCTNSVHRKHIDRYYSRFIDVVYRSAAAFAQRSTDRLTRTPAVPGWSDYVQDNYDKAKEAFVCWVHFLGNLPKGVCGGPCPCQGLSESFRCTHKFVGGGGSEINSVCRKPRCGLEYDAMYKTRAAFKLELRYCKRHDTQLRADADAKNLLSMGDYQKFWQGIKKDGCCKSQKYANCVDNAVGDTDICAMWKEHFNSVYNSVPNNGVKENVLGTRERHEDPMCWQVTIADVYDILSRQKRNRSAVPIMVCAWRYSCMVILEFCYILACFSRVVLATVTFPLHLWILNLYPGTIVKE